MGLGEGENDVVFECHKKFYENVGDISDIAICENVKESNLEQTMHTYLGAAWDVKACCVDPRLFGLGCARARCYGIGWKKSQYEWNKVISLERLLGALKAQPVMTADSYFFLTKTPTMKLSPAEDPQFVTRSPKLKMDEISPAALAKAAGNGMSVPCVGAFILATIMCIDRVS
eukprot:s810_g8.t1